MEQEELQKLVEENIDNQVGLDCATVYVSFGISQIEVTAMSPMSGGIQTER